MSNEKRSHEESAQKKLVKLSQKTFRDTRLALVISGLLLMAFGVLVTILVFQVPEISVSRSFGSYLLKSGCAAAAFIIGGHNCFRAAILCAED
jgi:uncharacterized membrane protein HdeD (DUF308 family)